MATEVFLMENVKDLGSEGDVVTVSNGYARNYLLPKNLAAPVTAATRKRLAKIQSDREVAKAVELKAAHKLAARLEGVSCTIAVKTMDEEKLYGSVSVSDIAEELKKQGIEMDRHVIQLDEPIKELGVYNVKIDLGSDVEATVKVWVVEE